jgi:RNA-binding protein YlmH
MPGNYLSELVDPQISCISIKTTSKFGEMQHRDVLGAIVNLGLKREKFGDIIMSPDGAQLVVADEVKDIVLSSLVRVGRANVETSEIEFEQLAVEPERVKEIKATVASLRLDAVASEGFSTSRTKMAREIKAQKLKVNWKDTDDPDMDVSQGDVISMRGRGRVVLEQVTGNTKKGRIGIILKRYI